MASQGEVDLLLTTRQPGRLAVYLSSPTTTSEDERLAAARAFLGKVAMEPSGDRDGVARMLATEGGISHADNFDGGPVVYTYIASADLPGSAETGWMLPGVLENRTDPKELNGAFSDVVFSREMDGTMWRLTVSLPRMVLSLGGNATATFDSLGFGQAWAKGDALPEAEALQDAIASALADAGVPGGDFTDWNVVGPC